MTNAGVPLSDRYPDPMIRIFDERFTSLRIFSSGVERLATGCRWAEGPVWFGDGRYLLWSDVPGNRILRWDDTSGAVSIFREPANHSNGQTRDLTGRLITCEHLTRRVTRTEYDGSMTVIADQLDGKRLNSPNDVVCASDGAIWFTDPSFGILSAWEGEIATSEVPHAVYRVAANATRKPVAMITDLKAPNGLAFNRAGNELYVVESRAEPHRRLWAYAIRNDGQVGPRRLVYEAQDGGGLDGIAVDHNDFIYCGYGSAGKVDPTGIDGVRVIDPQGQALAHIDLPERCANLCFGGAKMNRLFMTASRSLYALYLNTRSL